MKHFPLRRLAIDGGYVCAFNLLCAVLLTFVFGGGRNFGPNLVISMCIGCCTWLLIDTSRLLLWGEGKRPNWLQFALILLLAVPLAQMLGARIAGWILGVPLAAMSMPGSGQFSASLLFTLLATLGVTLFFANRDRVLKLRAEAAEQQRLAMQAQLQALQAQIEPHMLFNTLANVQGLIAIDPPRAQQMLDQLIQYLRGTLQASRAERTLLVQEFALLEAYLGLMAVRMGERLSYSIDLPPALRDTPVPPMLLQPLVENAIAHGVEPSVGGGHVSISAQLADGRLSLSVSDSGRGLAAGPGKAGTGMALQNIRARLQGLYGERASLELVERPGGGATARLDLPV